ncbi:HAD-IIA family hydrolase [Nocardioides sp. DS6]|uniref:HAD-IIA family hydrolase n=1 Tax=Nocardioides eburneus TaxID=3231482 RepID=A0ABV3T7A4_9ACTN
MLEGSARPLSEVFDLAMLDLDGVVYVGGQAVPRAPESLAAARVGGLRLAFITNNASRAPQTVADHLSALGVPASASDVVTSAQAAAHVLREQLGAGAKVVLLGAEGLRQALLDVSLVPVTVEEEAAAVVSGFGPDVTWGSIMHAAVRIRDGLWWVASNTDATFPTSYGTAPGHGVLVDTLRRFSGVEPVVAGKPARPLLDETIRRVGGEHPVMVGDRLDTDIAGAHHAGVPSLLVLTGVTGLRELVAAGADERPTYLSLDLRGLQEAHGRPELREDGVAVLGGWEAYVESGRLRVDGTGGPADWWRTVATAAWAHLDATGEPVDVADLDAPPANESPSTQAGAR